MKKFFNLLLILVVFSQTGCNGQSVKTNKKGILPDSMVVKFWGDTVCDILFSPAKVNCYTLKPSTRPDENSKIIGGYVVEQSIGSVTGNYYPILQFLLSDHLNYQTDSASVNKCPFLPYLAFEFTKKKEKACLLVAYNCKEWGIVYKGVLHTMEYRCDYQLIRFALGILPNDKYLSAITNL